MTDNAESPENKELVKALESIRGLLEKSESKLSAARDSLEKAKQPSKPTKKAYKKPPISTEPVVPVLDDVVLPEPGEEEDEPTMLEIPSFDANQYVPPVAKSTTPSEKPPVAEVSQTSGHSTKEVHALIDELQKSIEKSVHETLVETLAKLELDVKASIQTQIQTLRDQVDKD